LLNIVNNKKIMKRILSFCIVLTCLMGCNSEHKEKKPLSVSDLIITDYTSFGEKITSKEIVYKKQLIEKLKTLKRGDTIALTFSSTVNDVCKAKGCWMKFGLENSEEIMVKFKDYGFFVPKDIEKDTVIVQGIVYLSETSIEELKHLATDAGKSEKEIAEIIAPKQAYASIADGVLIKNINGK